MAERRMFAKTIIDSDAFLDMPLTAQALYFHLSMRADDDGFINNPKKIMRTIGANQNDYDLLLAKSFIIVFPDGICVIKHWRIHNYLQKDRYKPTVYQEHMNQLFLKNNKSYTLKPEENDCIQIVYNSDTQSRLGQYSDKEKDKNVINHFLTEILLESKFIDPSDDLIQFNNFFEEVLKYVNKNDSIKITKYICEKTRNKEITNKFAYFLTSFHDGIKNIDNARQNKSLSDFIKNSLKLLNGRKD